jgi:hypothetical protein
LRQRNAANDAWIVVGLLNQSTNTFNVPVAQGGTGLATLTANNVLLGNGTSAVQAVAPGTSGNVLTSNGTTWQSSVLAAANLFGRVPAANAPLGSVIQVVSATHSILVATTSTTFTDTGLTATITPSSATSKILVLVTQPTYIVRNNDSVGILGLKLLRNSTDIYTPFPNSRGGFTALTVTAGDMAVVVNMTKLDSPATTSAVTYKTQIKVRTASASAAAYANAESAASNAESTITLMEIAA